MRLIADNPFGSINISKSQNRTRNSSDENSDGSSDDISKVFFKFDALLIQLASPFDVSPGERSTFKDLNICFSNIEASIESNPAKSQEIRFYLGDLFLSEESTVSKVFLDGQKASKPVISLSWLVSDESNSITSSQASSSTSSVSLEYPATNVLSLSIANWKLKCPLNSIQLLVFYTSFIQSIFPKSTNSSDSPVPKSIQIEFDARSLDIELAKTNYSFHINLSKIVYDYPSKTDPNDSNSFSIMISRMRLEKIVGSPDSTLPFLDIGSCSISSQLIHGKQQLTVDSEEFLFFQLQPQEILLFRQILSNFSQAQNALKEKSGRFCKDASMTSNPIYSAKLMFPRITLELFDNPGPNFMRLPKLELCDSVFEFLPSADRVGLCSI